MSSEIEKTREVVSKLYKTEDGKPLILTDTQCLLFNLIFKRQYPRNHVQCPTRYGKSLVVALAVLTRASLFPEKWAIVSQTSEKAMVIMEYIISHIFDNPVSRARFIRKPDETEESIRRYKRKDKINFDLGERRMGTIYITTAENALGLGAANLVEDEAATINNKEHALVMRMLGEQIDNFLVKIGNPWDMEHFRKSFEDPKYHKLIIDCWTGLKEGRYVKDYLDEMARQPYFDVLYECKFPATGADDKNWVPLLSREEIERAMTDQCQGFGENKLGVDVAGGGRNFSVIVNRRKNVAEILLKSKSNDTMELTESILTYKNFLDIQPYCIGIDKIGIGRGVYDSANRIVQGLQGINVGENAIDDSRFVNLKAELAWKVREWILGGGKLKRDDDWFQLSQVKYRAKLDGTKRGRMEVISKEELLRKGIDSPDCFVAGTQILTPIGEKPIEKLIEGEQVVTPFGNRTIVKKWEVKTDKLHTVIFSNGKMLVGKGKHKIMTKNGWCRLDTLAFTDIIETRNKLSSIIWKIKSLLFIRERNIGLYRLEDIFTKITKSRVKGSEKPYITKFGRILLVKSFLADIVYTISIKIPLIIYRKTLGWLRRQYTPETTLLKDCPIVNFWKSAENAWKPYVLLPLYGINQTKEENGIGNIQKNNGKILKQQRGNVLCAEKISKPFTKLDVFAEVPVNKKQNGKAGHTIRTEGFVYSVKRLLWQIGIGIQNVAVESVRFDTVLPTKVYNLTLDQDNVYYANGILVNNCYDALALTFATPDVLPQSEEEIIRLKEESAPKDKFGLFLEI